MSLTMIIEIDTVRAYFYDFICNLIFVHNKSTANYRVAEVTSRKVLQCEKQE